jgi:toxin ParE1/3/4
LASFRFSNLAVADLNDIVAYTKRTWGDEQTVRYLAKLEAAVRDLAKMETLGRKCDEIRAGLWRIEVGSHVVFFRRDEGVLVCRVLHFRMLPDHQPIDDTD